MAKAISLHRCTTFGVSCLIHVVLVCAAIALGRDLVAPKVPTVLVADLTLIETPRLIETPAQGAPAPAPPKPQKLKLPKSIATLMPAPAIEPEAPETRAPIVPPPPAAEPGPPAREAAASSAPATSFEVREDSATTQQQTDASRGGSSLSTAPPSIAARPSDGITQMAIPRGGYQVRPAYPSSARRLGIQGMTTLRVYVAADGRVGEVMVQESAGHPDLDNAAADAVKQWRFEPGRRGAEPVGVWVLLPVQFRLR